MLSLTFSSQYALRKQDGCEQQRQILENCPPTAHNGSYPVQDGANLKLLTNHSLYDIYYIIMNTITIFCVKILASFAQMVMLANSKFDRGKNHRNPCPWAPILAWFAQMVVFANS